MKPSKKDKKDSLKKYKAARERVDAVSSFQVKTGKYIPLEEDRKHQENGTGSLRNFGVKV